MTFTLDTSGAVPLPHKSTADQTFVSTLWSDLTPFAQGYVGALPWAELTTSCARCQGNGEIVTDWKTYLHPPEGAPADAGTATCPDCDGQGERTYGFSDLSPEALALILRDCATRQGELQQLYSPLRYGRTQTAGANFWKRRQSGLEPDYAARFPVLTPYLSDDGKICLREAGRDGRRSA